MTMTISGDGSITGLAAGGLPDASIQQADLAAGVAGTGPAFSASKSANQTGISNSTYTKVTFNTEVFDTNNNFASSTFTPTVAGYYQINAVFDIGATVSYGYGAIFKNGSAVIFGSGGSVSSAAELISSMSGLVYCNGTTDYIEIYVYVTSSSNVVYGSGASFSGALVRAA